MGIEVGVGVGGRLPADSPAASCSELPTAPPDGCAAVPGRRPSGLALPRHQPHLTRRRAFHLPCLTPRQMVSLLHLADINEEGVTFQSPTDGRRMLLTPEHSIQASHCRAFCGSLGEYLHPTAWAWLSSRLQCPLPPALPHSPLAPPTLPNRPPRPLDHAAFPLALPRPPHPTPPTHPKRRSRTGWVPTS